MTNDEQREFWKEVLQLQADSRLTIKAFCEQEGLAVHQFYYWRKQLVDVVQQVDTPFVAVEFAGESGQYPPISVYAGELRVEVVRGFCASTLRRVLDVVGENGC
ncbi:hypothetical protein BVY04_03535 [bacterium M21]|nr:hypothetical protein BVY04_03535 [bacterium M21]